MSELESSLLEDDNDQEISLLEETFTDDSFIKKVDKYNSQWNPSFLFNGFNTRAVLKKPENNCLLERESQIQKLKRKLSREAGEEEEDWYIEENQFTGDDELYMEDSSILTMWLIQAPETVKKIFEVIYEAE